MFLLVLVSPEAFEASASRRSGTKLYLIAEICINCVKVSPPVAEFDHVFIKFFFAIKVFRCNFAG